MTSAKPPQRRQGMLELHVAILLLGLSGLFGKLELPSTLIVFGRAVFSSATLGLVLLWQNRSITAAWKMPTRGAVLSGMLLAIHWIAFYKSIQVSTVAVGLLTFSSFPLFVTILEPWFFRERRRWLDLITALLVVAGLSLVVPNFDFHNHITQGAFLGIVSGLLYAVLCILNRKLLETQSVLTLTWSQHLTVAILLLPAAIWIGEMPTPREIQLLAVLGIVCTALAHYLFIRSLSFVRVQLASVVMALESVYAILFAVCLLGEVPGVRTLVGGAVILTAVVTATVIRPQD